MRALMARHGVAGSPSLLSDSVREQFQQALRVGSGALLESLEASSSSRGSVLFGLSRAEAEDFLASPEVASELSKLLDPGLEVLDTVLLANLLAAVLRDADSEVRVTRASDAWRAFLRAFSFSSRSSPALREFLRASYEAGTFRAISGISGALDSLGHNIAGMLRHEAALHASIRAYSRELSEYRAWAMQAAS